jgi:RNA polymerase sigma-70 factor (ECF subfamily)
VVLDKAGGRRKRRDDPRENQNVSPAANPGPVQTVLPERDAEEVGSTADEEVAEQTTSRTGVRLEEEQLGPLVERARMGEIAAFEEIVRLMQGPVRSFARRMMRDAYLGDDAAQETFFRMWKGIARHQPRGRFIAWSFTVARNTCIEFLRREGRTPRPVAEIQGESHDPMHDIDVGRVVNEAIAELDEPYRSTFLLRETGLAYEEVAEALDCPVGTVRSRLHEARKRLASRLRPEFGGAA